MSGNSRHIIRSLYQLLTFYDQQLRDSTRVDIREKENLFDQCVRVGLNPDRNGYVDVVEFMNKILEDHFFDQFFKVSQVDGISTNDLDLTHHKLVNDAVQISIDEYIPQVTTMIQEHFEEVKRQHSRYYDPPIEYLIVYPPWANQRNPKTTLPLDLKEIAKFYDSFRVKIGDKTYRPVMTIYQPSERRQTRSHFVSMIYNTKKHTESIIEDDLEDDSRKVSSIKGLEKYGGVPRVILFKDESIPLAETGVAHLTNDRAKCFLNSALQLFSRIPAIRIMLEKEFKEKPVSARALSFHHSSKTARAIRAPVKDIQEGVFNFLEHKISKIHKYPDLVTKYRFPTDVSPHEIKRTAQTILKTLRRVIQHE